MKNRFAWTLLALVTLVSVEAGVIFQKRIRGRIVRADEKMVDLVISGGKKIHIPRSLLPSHIKPGAYVTVKVKPQEVLRKAAGQPSAKK